MVWSSIIAEQHRRKNGHHRFSSCKRLCRGVSDLLSGDFCRDCKVKPLPTITFNKSIIDGLKQDWKNTMID